jgi:glutaconate CoA-transferase subunit A
MPHECYGLYEPAMNHLDAYVDQVNSDPVEGMRRYLDTYVYGPKSWNDFLSLIGTEEVMSATRKGRSIFDV